MIPTGVPPPPEPTRLEQLAQLVGIDADELRALLRAEIEEAERRLIQAVAPKLGPQRQACPLGVETMLDMALITAPDKRDPALVAKLDAVAGRVLKKG